MPAFVRACACVCVRACVRACMRPGVRVLACVRACMRACVRACDRSSVLVRARMTAVDVGRHVYEPVDSSPTC